MLLRKFLNLGNAKSSQASFGFLIKARKAFLNCHCRQLEAIQNHGFFLSASICFIASTQAMLYAQNL